MNPCRNAIFALLALALTSAGCSFSYSSASISDSIASSSKSVSDSISSSSGGSSASEKAYREDVRDYTARAVKDKRSVEALEAGLPGVAETHGVTDWEADQSTWLGVGEGLRKAKATQEMVDAWGQKLSQGGASRASAARLIQQGYAPDPS